MKVTEKEIERIEKRKREKLYWRGKPYQTEKPVYGNDSEDCETFIVSDGDKDYWIHWYGDNRRVWGLTIRHSSTGGDYESYNSTCFRGSLIVQLNHSENTAELERLELDINTLRWSKNWAIVTHGLGKTHKTNTEAFIRDLIEIDRKIMRYEDQIENLKKQRVSDA